MAYSILSDIYQTNLTKSEKSILLRLTYVGKESICNNFINNIFITIERLAFDCGFSYSTAQRSLKRLEGRKIIFNDKENKYSKNHWIISKAALTDLLACGQVMNNHEKDIHKPVTMTTQVVTMTTPGGHYDHQTENIANTRSDTLMLRERVIHKDNVLLEITPEKVLDKIKIMRKYNEIRGRSADLSNTELAHEVLYHVKHRNRDKTPSEMHAFKGACSLIRQGKWQKPLALIREKEKTVVVQSMIHSETLDETLKVIHQNKPDVYKDFIDLVNKMDLLSQKFR